MMRIAKKKRDENENNCKIWQMNGRGTKPLNSLLRQVVSLYPHNLKLGKNIFKPPTIVWTTRASICNDINEVLQYKQINDQCMKK